MESMRQGALAGQQLTICQICLEDMTNKKPRALRCLHTFCEECLKQQPKNMQGNYYNPYDGPHSSFYKEKRQTSISCPICRADTVLSKNGVCDLPHNFLLQQMVGLAAVYSRSDLCQCCVENATETITASVVCTQCDRRMCNMCLQNHSAVPVFKGHDIQPFTGKMKDNTELLCSRHGNNVELFCKSCVCGICVDCAVAPEHNSHAGAICDLNEASTFIINCVTNIGEQISNEALLVKSADAETMRNNSDFNRVSAAIKQQGEKLKNEINHKVEWLIHQLSENRRKNLETILESYSPFHDEAIATVSELSNFLASNESNGLITKAAEKIKKGQEMLNQLQRVKGTASYDPVEFKPETSTPIVGELNCPPNNTYGKNVVKKLHGKKGFLRNN